MNEHAEIMTEMQAQLSIIDSAILVMPKTLAVATYRLISPEQADDRLVEYLSVEMLKVMARKLLGQRFGVESDDGETYQACLLYTSPSPRD